MRVSFAGFNDRMILTYVKEELIYRNKIPLNNELIKRLDGIIAKTPYNSYSPLGWGQCSPKHTIFPSAQESGINCTVCRKYGKEECG